MKVSSLYPHLQHQCLGPKAEDMRPKLEHDTTHGRLTSRAMGAETSASSSGSIKALEVPTFSHILYPRVRVLAFTRGYALGGFGTWAVGFSDFSVSGCRLQDVGLI